MTTASRAKLIILATIVISGLFTMSGPELVLSYFIIGTVLSIAIWVHPSHVEGFTFKHLLIIVVAWPIPVYLVIKRG